MVRYIRNDEIYHSGVKGMRWYHRLYQYKDGSYTPLGRIHYGIGINKKELTGAERIAETVKAARDTAAGYGLVKYKEHKKVIKGNKRYMKADQRRAEKAYAMRQEIKAKAKAEKEKLKALYAEKKAENERKLKEEQEARAKARAEEAEQKALFRLKQKAENEAKAEEKQSQKNVDEAKQNYWKNYSNEDLAKYAERVRLEAAATEAKLKKMDAPRQLINTLVAYGSSGLAAFNVYRNFKASFKDYKEMTVPTPVQTAALDLVDTFNRIYQTGALKDPEMAVNFKTEMFKEKEMLEAMSQIFNYSKRPTHYANSGGNQNGGGNQQKKGGGK